MNKMTVTELLKNYVLLDGATGTELQKRGLPLGSCSELWNLAHPEAIMDLQRSYVNAGSQIVYAPTFTANRPSLEKHKAGISVAEANAKLVALSREAVGSRALVAGDMSSCGLQMEPYGESSYEEVVDVFTEQAAALESAGVDLFAVETQISFLEAKATVEAIRRVSEKPIFVSFACGPTGKSLWGDDLAELAGEMEALGVSAYGVNCCGDLDMLVSLVGNIRKNCSLPIIAKPNAGMPENEDGKTLYRMTPEKLASYVPALLDAGAALLGGCCGTTDAHIAAIRDAIRAYSANAGK